jgi:ComF family protein
MASRFPTIKQLLTPITEFVFPPTCLCCHHPLHPENGRLCLHCRGQLKSVDRADQRYLQALQRLRSTSITSLVTPYYFDEGPVQSLIHQLKYGGTTRIGIELGRSVGEALQKEGEEIKDAILVPVPLHRAKERERGYNQSLFISQGIREVTGLQISSVIKRLRYTRSQTTLTMADRMENVKDAFVPATMGVAMAGRTFILVDDVITTGSTLAECARVLHAARARAIYACSIALAP